LSEWNTDGLILGAALASRLDLAVGDWVTFILPAETTLGLEPIRVHLSAVLDSKTELDEVLALVHHDTFKPFAKLQQGDDRVGAAVNRCFCGEPDALASGPAGAIGISRDGLATDSRQSLLRYSVVTRFDRAHFTDRYFCRGV
jgi:hypothetical protein